MTRFGLSLGALALISLTTIGPHVGRAGAPTQVANSDAMEACVGCNVLLISIDTLRADHVGSYGYGRQTTPMLDRLATRSVLFEQAHSTAYVTADSHMSVMTSLYPSVHAVRNAVAEERSAQRLHPQIATLAELLKAGGYRTGAITGGGNIAGIYGFDRGMDVYLTTSDLDQSVAQAQGFVDGPDARPFFLFWHSYHVHDPYTPRSHSLRKFSQGYAGRIAHERAALSRLRQDSSFQDARKVFWSLVNGADPRDRAHLRDLYDAEIRELDEKLGALVRSVRARHPRTLVVVMSDHGEQFGEHGGFLHNDLYQELLHVPLIWSHPGRERGLRVEAPVSLVDLAPSLLDSLGLPLHPQFQGRPLAPVARGLQAGRPVFAEKDGRAAALRVGGQKVLVRMDRAGRPRQAEGYDLRADPRELGSLAPEQTLATHEQLDRIMALNRDHFMRVRMGDRTVDAALPGLDAAMLEQLRALGYVD